MKAKELRIGNLVMINNDVYRKEDTGKIATVYSIADRGSYGYSVGCRIDEFTEFGQLDRYIEPIPLTEDCLIKLNCPDTFMSRDNNGFFVWFNGDKIYLKYVHELQNAYFILRGNELTSK